MRFLATVEMHRFLRNVWLGDAHQNWHYCAARASRLSFILALTIYYFHLLLLSEITPQVSTTKEAVSSENRDAF